MSDKFITELGLKTVLTKLRDWFPFRKKVHSDGAVEVQFGKNNENSDEAIFSVGIENQSSPGTGKNAFEVQKDGDIYILDSSGKKVKLQNALSEGGSGPSLTMEGYNDLIIANEDTQNNAYDIQEDDTVQMAIKKLDKRSENTVVEKDTYLEFPTIGKRDTTYIEKSTGKQFIWDVKTYSYVQISSDVIVGGGASDWIN